MPRPTDWSVLGLSNDPTPGDAPRLERVIESQKELVRLAGVVDDGLRNVRNTTDGAFVGRTADALREVIDNRLRKFVETFAAAHRDVGNALTTYHGVMVEEQRKADNALESARGLGDDDEAEAERSRLRSEAEEAGTRQSEAAEEAARVLRSAASSISSPVDPCDEIWKALQILAIILILPAILLGGPLALFTIALNAAILIKTAIDFSQGKAGVADLVFAILGIIAPSTRALNIGKVWGALGNGFRSTRDFFKMGPNVFSAARLSGAFGGGTRITTLWVRGSSGMVTPIRINAPVLGGIQASVLRGVGWTGYTAIRLGVGLARFGPTAFRAGVHGAMKFRFISFFLPVAREEMRFGMGLAFRIGFIDRGLFGKHIYGFSPTVTAGIRGGAGAASGIGTGVMVLSRPGGAGFGAGGFGVPTPGMGGMGGFTAPNVSGVGAGVGDLRVMPPIGVPVRPNGISAGGPAGPVVPSIVTPGSLTPPGGLSGIGGLGPGGLAPGGLGSVNLGQISLSPLSVLRTPMGGIDMPAMSARIADLPSIGAVQPPQLGSMSSMTGMGGITIGSPGAVNLGALAPTPAPVAVNNAVTAPTVTAPSVSAPQLGSIAAPAPVSPGAVSLGAVNPGTVSPGGLNPGSVSLGGVNAGGINPGGLNPGGLNPGTVSLGGVNAGAINTAGLNVGSLNAGGMSLGGINAGATAPGVTTPHLGAVTAPGHIPASLSGTAVPPVAMTRGIEGITSLGGITSPGNIGVTMPGSMAGVGPSTAPGQHLLNVPSLSQTSLGQTPALPSITARIVDLPGVGIGGSPTHLGGITTPGAVTPGAPTPPAGAVINPGSVPTPDAISVPNVPTPQINATLAPAAVTPGTVTPGTVIPGTVTPGTVAPGTVTPPPVTHVSTTVSGVSPASVAPAPAPGALTAGTITPGTSGSIGMPTRPEAGLQSPSLDGRVVDLPGVGLGGSPTHLGGITTPGAVTPGGITPPPAGAVVNPGSVPTPDAISVPNIPTPQINGALAPTAVTPGTVTPGTVTPGTVTPGTVAPGTVTPPPVTHASTTVSGVSPAPVAPGAVTPGNITPGTSGSIGTPIRPEAGLQSPSLDGRITDLATPQRTDPAVVGSTGSTGPVSSLPAPAAGSLPEGYVNPAHITPITAGGTALPAPAVARADAGSVAPTSHNPTAHTPTVSRPGTPTTPAPTTPHPVGGSVTPPGPVGRVGDAPMPGTVGDVRGVGNPGDAGDVKDVVAPAPTTRPSAPDDSGKALAALNRLLGHDPAWHRLLMERMGIDQGVRVFMMHAPMPTPAQVAVQPFDFAIPGGAGGRVTFDGTTPTVTTGTNGHPLRVDPATGGNPVVRITEELGPNATRQWTIGPTGNPIGTGVQRVTVVDDIGSGTTSQVTLRLDGAGVPERVTHVSGGGVTTGNVSLLPGGTELRITDPATGNFTLHTTTGDLRYGATSLQLHNPGGGPAHPLANHYLTTTPGGDLGLLRAGPDPDHPGGTVFRPVDGATVTPQTGAVDLRTSGDALRVHQGEHHLIIDINGRHTHDVTALHGIDGRPIPDTHLFTPITAPGAAPGTVSLRTDLGAPAPNATRLPTGHWHVTDTTTGNFTLHTAGGDLDYHALSLRNPDGGPAHPLGNHYLTTTPTGDLGLLRTDGAPVPTLTPQPATIAPQPHLGQGVTRIDGGGHHLVVDGNGRHIHDAITLRGADGAPTGTHLFTPPNGAGTAPGAIAHTDLGGPVPNTTVTRVDGHWHVTDTTTGNFTRHTDTGAVRYDALNLRNPAGGPAHPMGNHYLTTTPQGQHGLLHSDGAPVPTLTPQPGTIAPQPAMGPGVTRIDAGGHHLVVDGNGRHIHDAITLRGADGTPTGTHLFTPPNAAGTAPGAIAHTDLGGPVPNTTVTRVDGHWHVTDTTTGNFTRHTDTGALEYRALSLHNPAGGPAHPLANHYVTTTPTNNVGLLHAGPHATNPGVTVFRAVDGATVTPQTGAVDLRVPGTGAGTGDALRVRHGDHDLIVAPNGAHTHTVVAPRGADGQPIPNTFLFTPTPGPAGAAPGAVTVRAGDGAQPTGLTLRTLNGDHVLTTTAAGTFTRHAPDGSFVHGGLKLDRAPLTAGGSGLVRTFEGNGPLVLLDDNLARIADLRVGRTPGGNVRVGNGDHEFDLFNANGQLTHTVRAVPAPPVAGPSTAAATPPPAGSALTVTDVNTNTSFTVIRASDGADALFLDTTALRALDGDLNVVGPLTREGTDFRLNDPRGGAHLDEFRRYDATGKLTFERINIVHGNAMRPGEHFEITLAPAAGGKPTWVRVTPGHPAGPGARGWFDGGTVDTKGLANGRVRLLDAGKVEVFERRLLPGGNTLDFHRASTSTQFGPLNQRGVWSEINGNGAVVGHGTRHFGESTRSWFDVRTQNGFDLRVRHFRENPDGGHVLADMNTHAFLQGGHRGTWVRFDGEFKPIASGTREFTHGRGWRDHTIDPATGKQVLVHEKFGRFNPLTAADNRSYFQRVIEENGTVKPDWTTISAHNKENAFGKTLKDGNFLEGRRLMEQRPPAWLRNAMLPINGNALATNAPWLGGGGIWNTLTRADGLHQAFALTLRAAPDGAVLGRGARFVASDTSTLDISATGVVTGHTRKLFHGSTLTVGDVDLPTGAARRDGYLPWKDGDGGPRGHRSFDAGDIGAVTLPNGVTGTVRWVDRYPGAAGITDWYTPTPHRPAGGTDPDWRTARIGLTDGRVIDFRATPEVRATPLTDSAAHRMDIAPGGGRNPDHTVYDPQGVPVARADTFPHPNPPATGAAGTVSVRGTGGFDQPTLIGSRMTFGWSADINGTNLTGVRKVNFDRSMDRWAWDRESFQDFGRVGTNNEHLLREHRLLADGVTLDSWRVTKADGTVEWQWRKVDRHGNDLRFDTDAPGTQVRTWYDANGNLLSDWQPGARWVDTVHRGVGPPHVVQEMPFQPRITAADSFGDAPLRVREYVATPDKLDDALWIHPTRGEWREFDNGIVVRMREKAPDGTFLVSEEWQKHALRFDATDPTAVVGGRDIAGYVRSTADGGPGPLVLAGRDGNFLGNLNEFRGWDRMLREVNRWEWRGTSEGVPGYRDFGLKSAQSIGIDFVQDWLLDFAMNLTVYGIIAGVNGHEFTGMDVLKAMFGATVTSGTKSLITAGHHSHLRGGPGKVGLSSADQGQPFHRRPNDDSWAAEFAGNEKVTRWRAGSYDFGVNFATSSLAGFVNGAAMSAIFGVRDANGDLVYLRGMDALREGGLGMASGMAGGLSVGLGKTILQQTLGGRLFHRQGFFDIFVIGGLGKIAEKSFAGLFLTGALRDINPPDWRTPPAPDTGGAG